MSDETNSALVGWYSSDFRAERIYGDVAEAFSIPGYDGAYRIELIGIKRFDQGKFKETQINQYSAHEFVGDVTVKFSDKTTPNPASHTFRSLIIHSPSFTQLGYHEDAVFGHIEGFAEASIDTLLKPKRIVPIAETVHLFQDRTSCFSHSSGCWSRSFPWSSSACFNPYSLGAFGATGCFGAPILPGCAMMPGCFSLPIIRLFWNLLSLLGLLALLVSFICNIQQWRATSGDHEEQQRHQDEEFLTDDDQKVSYDERGYKVKDYDGMSLKGNLLFTIADHKDIDGDIVDVYVDDLPLELGLELTEEPYRITSTNLKPGELNTLKVYPVSVGRGSLKVCTARMTIYEECTGIESPPFKMILKPGEVGQYVMFVQSTSCE